MAAGITDLLTKASNGTAPVPTTLASQKTNGATSASISLATGWPTTTAVHGLLYKVDANNNMVANTLLVWKATLSGTTLSNFTVKSGTDDVYPAGSVIELAPTSAWADDIVTGLLVDHTVLGYHNDLHDTNGVIWIKQSATASAVNYVKIANAVTGTGPIISPDGTDSNPDLNINSKGTGNVKIDGAAPKKFIQNGAFNFIESGCVWSGDSYGATRNASMTAGVVWIAGKRLTVSLVTAHAFTASKDTYVDFADNGDGTAKIIYTEVTNNAASPSTLSDSSTFADATNIRNAIIITGASNIANSGSVNQGQETMVLPIASSVPYAVTDSLGNLICPRDPNRKILGYRQIITTFNTASTSATQITGLSCPVIIPSNRKIKITVYSQSIGAGAALFGTVTLWDGTVGSGSQLQIAQKYLSASGALDFVHLERIITPSATSKTYNAALAVNTSNANFNADSSNPSYIKVELV